MESKEIFLVSKNEHHTPQKASEHFPFLSDNTVKKNHVHTHSKRTFALLRYNYTLLTFHIFG